MRKMKEEKTKRRARRQFTDEFRAGAVRLVLEEGKTVSQVARDLDLTASALSLYSHFRCSVDPERERYARTAMSHCGAETKAAFAAVTGFGG